MENNNNMHDFLTVMDLDNFNEKVNKAGLNKTPGKSEEPQKVIRPETKYDTDEFKSYIVNPKDIPETILKQLADVVDKKSFFNKNDPSAKPAGPDTTERILSSIAVACILQNTIPVAVATLLDPTKENYKGIIPCDYYELKSGKSLEDRIQQDFFAVVPEKQNLGLAQELKRQLMTVAKKMFVINLSSDVETAKGLAKNGYKLISVFNTEWEQEPVELWIN
jgi:hypothetical protein